jgi:hypothetical protein
VSRPLPTRHARLVPLALLAAAALRVFPSPAASPGSGPGPLRVDCRAVAGRLSAAIDLAPAIGADLERRLGSGLNSSIRLTVSALDHSGAPAATAVRDFDIRFDVWTEIFAVTVREPGAAAMARQASDWATVRALLAAPAPFDLGPLATVPEPFTIEARLELDPVSGRQLEKTRERLTHPAGGPTAGARSLLGTLAAILLRAPPPDAERFRSAPRTRAGLDTP